MRRYTIGTRCIAAVLFYALLISMLPVMQFGVSAAITSADDGITYVDDQTRFLTAEKDGITMLNNGENISLSIKVNNFANDGLLFEYLSSASNTKDADDYLWEYCKDDGKAFVQLYPYKLRNQVLGQTSRKPSSTDENYSSDTPNAYQHGLRDADGFVGVTTDGTTLDSLINYGYDDVGNRSDGVTGVERTLIPYTWTENGAGLAEGDYTSTPFLRLDPHGEKDANGDNPDGTGKGRAWTKLTTFASTQEVENIRYAVVIYRLPYGPSEAYANFGLTVNCFDEAKGSCSKYVPVDTGSNSNWQYAIIDLMGLGASDTRRIAAGTDVKEVYLQTPLRWDESGSPVMDLAAVAYFPYYGDAEQFAYYGVTLGCQQKYFNSNNASFSFRAATRTHGVSNYVQSLPDWIKNYYDLGSRQVGILTYEDDEALYGKGDNSTYQKLSEIQDLAETIDYLIFGDIKGAATIGLLESTLDETGRPAYKESVVDYVATYLRHQLTKRDEYPSDNNGWRNYSFITGASTTGGTNEAMFGTNSLGQSIDLATAICTQLGVEKGNETAGYASGLFGSYNATLAHKDELIGTWKECKDNIGTWTDAAYYLLHNLYVTETEVADAKVDGYGEYEDDYQSLVLPQVQLSGGQTAYFFDSGYAYYTDIDDADTYSTALTFNKTEHTITLNGDAQGKAQFCDTASYQTFASYFPFLLTSGTGTKTGETNPPYYLHGGVLSRDTYGTTYRDRDFHYALSGSGYFGYKSGLYFDFEGDDDVYIYINGQLVVDIGGTHSATSYKMDLDDYVNWAFSVRDGGVTYKGKTYANLDEDDKARVDALCLVPGGVYSFNFFYMERHGVGSNLRIMTNMEIAESGLDVDKFAYQNGHEVTDNGIVDVDERIEYGFSITNNSDGKLYDLSFSDTTIGVFLDAENGLQTTGDITNVYGSKLTPSSLEITVDGYTMNDSGELEKMASPVSVTCVDNEALKSFLRTLSSDGTQTGDEAKDYDQLYAGSGLWKNATVTIRGIYYQMTDAQKSITSFTNSVVGSGVAKIAVGENDVQNYVLRGVAKHTVYQPGNPSYYQWIGHPIFIESERLYNDLIDGKVVSSAADLPEPSNMILIPSNATGTEVSDGNLSNATGGDVYLKVNYDQTGSYMAYVTILDKRDAEYSITVPITIYALGGQDSVIVLDYGMDSYLTEGDAIFDYELDAAVGDIAGSVLGIADDSIAEDSTKLGYVDYDEDKIINAAGQIANDMTLVSGSYSEGTHTDAVYQFDTSVFLDHNKPWVIEWKANHTSNVMLFSEQLSSTTGNKYVYMNLQYGNVFLGENNIEHIQIGTAGDTVYNNYGAGSDKIAEAYEKGEMGIYKMVNEPDGSGGNMVRLYFNGEDLGPMNNYAQGGKFSGQTNDWLSGKDFTFEFCGAKSFGFDGQFEYIRIYEDGYQLTYSSWSMSGTEMVTNSTDAGVGYVDNTATHNTYTYNSNNKSYWTLDEPVTLAHDDNWQITFTAEGIEKGTIIMSAQDTNTTHATHIYFYPGSDTEGQMVYLGYRNPQTTGSHTNLGVDVRDVIPDFSMVDKHTYILRNQVLPTGGNMVYLYVLNEKNEEVLIGPMDSKYLGSYNLLADNTTEISGMDFAFHQIGENTQWGFFDSTNVELLEIRSKTSLNNSFEWICGVNSMVSNVVTDTKGNQILFTKDEDGVVEGTDGDFSIDGKGLKFEVTDFMDERYSIYVALAIHDRDFVPSRLDADEIDIGREVQLYKKVTVLPANVVYYEDDFPMIHYCGTEKGSFTELTEGLVTDRDDYSDTTYLHTGSSVGLTQSPDQDAPYGSDDAYQNDFSSISGGSVHTIAINNDGPLAWFLFTGRGFEISARTNADLSGMVLVEVYEKGKVTFNEDGDPISNYDNAVALIPVVSDFDNGNEIDGYYNQDNGGAEAIYQVPLLRYDDTMVTAEGFVPGVKEYVVVISGTESYDDYIYDSEQGWIGGAHVDSYLYLDGIRIYYPLGDDVSYNEDGSVVYPYGDKNDAIFEEIRNHIVEGSILVCEKDSAGLGVGAATVTWTEKYNDADAGGNSYLGNKVSSVDDYLTEGPNNEVYVDGTFTNGALAFYVREETAGTKKLLDIGVRAIDMGQYFGAAATGMKANLQLGVMDGDNSASWLHLATVASGTEQYYNVPWELCPTVEMDDGNVYYQVVIKVASFSDDIPAMISFSNIRRTDGLTIKTGIFPEADEAAEAQVITVTSGSESYLLLNALSSQMSATDTIPLYEAEAGAGFQNGETSDTPDGQPVITPQYPTLSFEDEVKYNIYFSIEALEDVALSDMGLITFDSRLTDGTVADAVDVIPGAYYNSTAGFYMVRTNGIPAAQMGDAVYFKVYAKLSDGSYVYSDVYGYSAVQYANDQLSGEADLDLKALVVAMLDYGAAAQVEFGYKTDALMNAGLTDDQRALVAAYEAGMVDDVIAVDSSKVGSFASTGPAFSGAYPTVSFEGAFAINYYFTPAKTVDGTVTMYYWDQDTYTSASMLTAENACGSVVMTQKDGQYHAAYTGIAAKQIDETVFVAVVYESDGVNHCSGVIPYSLGAYCIDCIAGSDVSMQALAKATAVYGCYAEKYFA